MRKARDFVEEYRQKGYPDDRIRIIASMRPEPFRSEVLKLLDASSEVKKEPGEEADKGTVPSGATEMTSENSPQEVPHTEEVQVPASLQEQAASSETTQSEHQEEPSQKMESHAEEEKEVAASAKSELKQLRSQLQKESKRAEELAAKLAEAEKALAATTEKFKAAQEELAKLQGVAQTNAALELKLTQAMKARAEIEAAHDQLMRRKDAAEARVAELTEKLAQTEKAFAEREAKDRSFTEQLAERDEKIRELQSALGVVREERKELCAQVEMLRLELSGLREKLSAANEQETALKKQLEELSAKQSEAEAKHNSIRAELEAHQDLVDQLRNKLAQKETELSNLRAFADREAAELRKRMEMEMRQAARQLTLQRKLTFAAAGVAVVLLLGMVIFWPKPSLSRAPAQSPALGISSDTGKSAQASKKEAQPSTSTKSETHEATPPLRVIEKSAGQTEAETDSSVVIYKVKKGDALWRICRDVLGDASPETLTRVARENNLTDLSKLQPGMELKLRKIEK